MAAPFWHLLKAALDESIVHSSFCLPLFVMHVDVMQQRIYDLCFTSYVLAFDELMRCQWHRFHHAVVVAVIKHPAACL
jgi:hypothetical protein